MSFVLDSVHLMNPIFILFKLKFLQLSQKKQRSTGSLSTFGFKCAHRLCVLARALVFSARIVTFGFKLSKHDKHIDNSML